jgi:hypothetical protein
MQLWHFMPDLQGIIVCPMFQPVCGNTKKGLPEGARRK